MNAWKVGLLAALSGAAVVEGCSSRSTATDDVPECTVLRACGGSTPAPLSEVPPQHRSTAQACSPTSAASMVISPYNATGTPCTSDGQCTSDAGVPGHCRSGACTVDECLIDDDCGAGGVCVCSSPSGGSAVQNRNYCVHGNCRVDSDCGANGYCSPSVGLCSVEGFFCHTPADTCIDGSLDCGASCLNSCHYFREKASFACLAFVCGGC
jgi:hypothetical protein